MTKQQINTTQLAADLTAAFPDWGFSIRLIEPDYPEITLHPSGGRHWLEITLKEKRKIGRIVRRHAAEYVMASAVYCNGSPSALMDWLGDNGFGAVPTDRPTRHK